MTPYYFWILIFVCISYLIVTDYSISQLFSLVLKYIRAKYIAIKWYIQYSPDNPFFKFILYRKNLKIAKELHKELVKKQ
jgi:hypothetical protein